MNKELYDRNNKLENYAYSFIHEKNFKEIFNMRFDVIIEILPADERWR